MTSYRREPSLRAQARALYREAAEKASRTHPSASTATPLPNPPPTKGRLRPSSTGYGGREQTEVASPPNPPLTDITERVRALYEDSVVPVREIARLAGVTERTIYKYARKLGWRPRVTRLVGSGEQRVARGAGGRFAPLADEDKVHARGIKALDPAGAARAAVRCVEAGVLSDAAAAQAVAQARERAARNAAEREADARLRVFETLCRTLVEAGALLHEVAPGSQAATHARRVFDVINRAVERRLPV